MRAGSSPACVSPRISDMLDLVNERTRQREAFREDVISGLCKAHKTLPSRWLYDDEGSELFERITALDEYYPTRTETAILREHAADMANFCGRSEEHTSELKSLMRISYAVFCLKKTNVIYI